MPSVPVSHRSEVMEVGGRGLGIGTDGVIRFSVLAVME